MLIAGGRIGSTRNPYLQMMCLGDSRYLIKVEQLRDLMGAPIYSEPFIMAER